MIKQILILLFCFVLSYCKSQNGIIEYQPDSYAGAPLKTSFVIDQNNAKWIGYRTSGLVKFDASGWTSFNTSNSQLPSNRIFDLYSNYFLFIATGGGMALINQGVWTIYNHTNGLAYDTVNGVYCDGPRIYAVTRNVLNIYYAGNWTHVTIPGITDHSFSKKYPVCADASGTVWVGTYQDGLYKYSNSTWTNYNTSNSVLNSNVIKCFLVDNNVLWIGTSGDVFQMVNGILTSLPDIYPDSFLLPMDILSISKSNSGKIYISNKYPYFGNAVNNISTAVFEISNSTIDLYYTGLPNLFSDLDSNDSIWFTCELTNHNIYKIDKAHHSNYGLNITNDNFKFLDINNVKAGYTNRGTMFWDMNGFPKYEVPKGSGCHANFGSGLWICGKDLNDSLHSSIGFFDQQGNDYWPGPLDTNLATIDTARSKLYDKVWKTTCFIIEQFKSAYANGSVTNGTYVIPPEILNWPAQGPAECSQNLAPFFDFNQDELYNPYDGDYPLIKGDEMLWWVFNDNLNKHAQSGGRALGIEVKASAWACANDPFMNPGGDLINNQTFFRYEITNRSDSVYHDAYIGLWSDIDLGYAMDDFVGFNVKKNTMFVYNGTSVDGNGQTGTYGAHPPVSSITLLKGPRADLNDGIDNDRDSLIDEQGETINISKFIYFNNGNSGPMADPFVTKEYFNYLSGFWKNGEPLTYGNSGYDTSSTLFCDFAYPGNSDPFGWGTQGVPQAPWTEITANNIPGDRRGIISMGPLTLHPGETKSIDLMFAFFRDTLINNAPDLDHFLLQLDTLVHWYNTDSIPQSCKQSHVTNLSQKNKNDFSFSVFPNPATSLVNITISGSERESRIFVFDVLGKVILQQKTTENTTSLNIQNLCKGIYMLKLENNGISKFAKIVKD